MKMHKYERTFVWKEYAHNIAQGSPHIHDVPQGYHACSKMLIACETETYVDPVMCAH
jgi:hypothetical protein